MRMDATLAAREQRLAAAAEWLLRMRDSSVTPEDIAAWRAWCRSAPENDQAFAEMLALWDVAKAVPRKSADAQAVADDGYDGEVPVSAWLAASRPAARRRYWTQATAFKMGGLLTATAAALVGISLYFFGDVRPRAPQEIEVVTGIGMQREVQLPDGSVITLAGGSRLTARFSAAERYVLLTRGEAYFRVAKDKHRPFAVQALDAKVTAVGTAFNVRAENHRVRVAVTEGVVEVARPVVTANRRSSDEKVHLAAGRELTWQAGHAAPVVTLVDQTQATSWLSGTLEFSDEPLSSVIAAVNRYSPTPLRIAEPAIGDYRFSGTVDVNRTDEWLAGLPDIFAVTVKREGGGAVIARSASELKSK